MKSKRVKIFTFLAIGAFLLLTAESCGGGDGGGTSASQRAEQGNRALQSRVYEQKNNIEFNNYNERQQIADDPSTILWCTAYPDNPNAKPFTTPIVGKITSSGKRPYSTVRAAEGGNDYGGYFSPEKPGPDKMYGSSVEYRYGFTPAHVYVDFTDMETFCTTEPTIYQATQTEIVIGTDPGLQAASAAAKAQLQQGIQPGTGGQISDAAGNAAQQTLQNATGK